MTTKALGALMLVAAVPAYSLTPASAYSYIVINDYRGYQTVSRSSDFGLHEIKGLGHVATLIGTDLQGTPFIQLGAGTSDAAKAAPFMEANMRYSWSIVSKDGSPVAEEVPVTISYKGDWAYDYWMLPYITGRYNLSPGYIQIAMSATFQTTLKNNAVDTRKAGLQMGAYNWGVERVDPPSTAQTQQNYVVNGTAEFEDSFQILAKPNTENFIYLQMAANERYYNTFHYQYANVSWSVAAYIDPVFTIAPEFADKYSIQVSAMPVVVSVPEPATYGLMLAGVGVLALARRRARPVANVS